MGQEGHPKLCSGLHVQVHICVRLHTQEVVTSLGLQGSMEQEACLKRQRGASPQATDPRTRSGVGILSSRQRMQCPLCLPPPPTHTHRGTNNLHFACINAEANSSHLVLSSGVMRVCHEQSPSVEHLTVKTPGNHIPELQGLYISSAGGIDCKGQTGSPSTPHPHSLVPFDLS